VPRLQIPTEILKVIVVDASGRTPEDPGVAVLVETAGGPLPLKMTADVAAQIYHAVYEEVREK
jgi:hypothetical protein